MITGLDMPKFYIIELILFSHLIHFIHQALREGGYVLLAQGDGSS